MFKRNSLLFWVLFFIAMQLCCAELTVRRSTAVLCLQFVKTLWEKKQLVNFQLLVCPSNSTNYSNTSVSMTSCISIRLEISLYCADYNLWVVRAYILLIKFPMWRSELRRNLQRLDGIFKLKVTEINVFA